MRGHDTHGLAHIGYQTSGDDAWNNVSASKDASVPGMRAWVARRLHDVDCFTLTRESNGSSWADL